MMMPSSRIRKLDVEAGPIGALCGSTDVGCNGSHDGDNYFRLELRNCARQTGFASNASAAAHSWMHAIHWIAAEVDEVAAERTKHFEEILVSQIREGSAKSIPDRAIET